MTENKTPNENLKKTVQVAGSVAKTTGKSILWTGKHFLSILGAGAVAGAGLLWARGCQLTHESPEKARERTVKAEQKVAEEVKENVDAVWGTTNDTSTIKKIFKKSSVEVAGAGVRFGGALREWRARKNAEKK